MSGAAVSSTACLRGIGRAGENREELGECSDQVQHETNCKAAQLYPVGPASPPQGRGVCRSWKERGRPHYLASERTVPASQPPAGSVPPSAVDTMSGEGELGEEGCGGETEAWGGKDDRAMYICAP